MVRILIITISSCAIIIIIVQILDVALVVLLAG